MVHGDEAAAAVRDGLRELYTRDDDDPRFSKEHELRRRADYARLMSRTVPEEQRTGRRFLEEYPHFDWEEWRRDVLSGRHVPTEEEVCAHSILPPTADLIELLLGEIKKDKKPGDDDVTNEILIYAELEDVYAALIAAVHVDPARRVPQEWRDTMAGGVYKGKGKPIDGITSYRWLCFTSGLAKLYEAFLLYRAEPTVFPDEGQSIGCNGVDVRQLIVLIRGCFRR